MRLLVTRPRDEADRFAEDLKALGHTAILAPLLTIETRQETPDLEGIGALVFTSLNGVRAFADNSSERGLPSYVVGNRTAAAARAAGFTDVQSADGNVDKLVELIASTRENEASPLLQVTGVHMAGDLGKQLSRRGYEVRRAVLYEAKSLDRLPDAARTALETGDIDGAVFFSPRTAASFVQLVRASGLEHSTENLLAFCLSPAIAAEAGAVTWANVRVAAHPTQAALLAALAETQQTAQEDASMAQDGETPGKDATKSEKTQKTAEKSDGSSGNANDASQRTTPDRTTSVASVEGKPQAATAAAGSGSTVTKASASSTPASAAEQVIARFGGLRPTATKLGVAVSTVQGWKARGHIPETRHEDLRAAAKAHGIEIDDIDLTTTQVASQSNQAAAPATINPWTEPASSRDTPAARETAATLGTVGPLSGTTRAAERQDRSDPDVTSTSRRQGDPAEDSRDDEEEAHHGEYRDHGPAPATASRGGGLVLGLGLAIVLFAGGAIAAVYTRDYWEPFLPADPSASLQTDVTGLNDRVARLEAAPPAVDPARLDRLSDRLDGIAEDLAGLPDGETGAAAITELERRLGELTAQVQTNGGATTTAGEQPSPAGVSPADVSRLEDRISQMTADLEDLRGTVTETGITAANAASAAADSALADSAALSELQSELSSLQEDLQEVQGQAQQALSASAGDSGLALALGQLRDALRFSAPFETELQAVRSLIPAGDPLLEALAPLETHAGRGVPTRDELAVRFEPMARSAVATSYDDSWSGRLMSRVSEAVSVRPVGEVEGDSARARIARAEARLDNDDLAGAVEALSGLQGQAAAIAETWSTDASARLAGEEALTELTRRTLARLTPATGPSAVSE